jgi:hypothetical protein
MTPKAKAFDLVKYIYDSDMEIKYYQAQKIALITVQEIICVNPHSNPFNTNVYSTMDFWHEVEKEIEKL